MNTINLPVIDVINDYKKGMSLNKISKKYKCSTTPIYKILKENNIQMRSISESLTLDLPADNIIIDYLNGLSPYKLANKYNCSRNAIVIRLKNANVYVYYKDLNIPINKMITEYQNGMNSIQLGNKYGCCQQTIINNLIKMNVYIRTKKEAWEDQELRDRRSVMSTEQWSVIENRERLSAIKQGIAYDEWENFAKEKLYCPDFNKVCKKSNRDKYNRRCFLCGLLEENNTMCDGRQQCLSVHHYDMNKMQGCNKIRWKLVPLCIHCHGMVHNELWELRITWLLDNVW